MGRLLVPAVLASLFAAQATDGSLHPIDDPEAYAVYAALLQTEWPMRVAHAKRLVIQRETLKRADIESCFPSDAMDSDWRDAAEGFRRENISTREILAGFALPLTYEVAPEAAIRALLHPRDFSEFYARYPDSGGFIRVSAVGFNADRSRAIAYMDHVCNNMCGGGTYHLLVKSKGNGQWYEVHPTGMRTCGWAS